MRLVFMVLMFVLLLGFPEGSAEELPSPFQLNGEIERLIAPSLNEDGSIELNNRMCPLMGKKSKKKRTFVYEGVKYRLCCKQCIKMMEADPESYALSKLEVQQLKETLHV